METAWLRCTITSGQFSGEFAVSACDYRGNGFSLFAPEDALRNPGHPSTEAIEGEMKVEILGRKGPLCLIRLPARTLEDGDVLTVSTDQIVPRSGKPLASPQ